MLKFRTFEIKSNDPIIFIYDLIYCLTLNRNGNLYFGSQNFSSILFEYKFHRKKFPN